LSLDYRSPTDNELAAVLGATHVAFGEELKDDEVERQRRVLPVDRILAAWDDGRPVGVTASYPFELTVPGGVAKAGGVTYVGVLPSHRRRGILRELMLRQLEDLHQRGEPLAILWASESLIYGRFGYGIASPETAIDAERGAFALRDDAGPRGAVRLVTAEEAAALFPPLYQSRRLERPGSLSRTPDWWTEVLLADPEDWRKERGLKYYALLEIDGEHAGYVLYRVKPKWEDSGPKGEVSVVELFATTPESTAELWRFIFGIDLIARVKSWRIDPAWSLLLMVTDPRRLHLSITDGLWLRFVDLEAALQARRFNDAEAAVLEVEDNVLSRNSGRFAIGPESRRTDTEPDVALHVTDLASAYLGAFTFDRLAAAGRARELRPGGLARATALFATPIPPHCPEGF
jgi:predicted acetyltransferase